MAGETTVIQTALSTLLDGADIGRAPLREYVATLRVALDAADVTGA